ncbi:MAG: hypothetical protein ACK5I7_04455 [Anaerotignum sp.]
MERRKDKMIATNKAIIKKAIKKSWTGGNVFTMVNASFARVKSAGSNGSWRMVTLILSIIAKIRKTVEVNVIEKKVFPDKKYEMPKNRNTGKILKNSIVGFSRIFLPSKRICSEVSKKTNPVMIMETTRKRSHIFCF